MSHLYLKDPVEVSNYMDPDGVVHRVNVFEEMRGKYKSFRMTCKGANFYSIWPLKPVDDSVTCLQCLAYG
jgi:hypothetical protein